jgi:hypothetical protein
MSTVARVRKEAAEAEKALQDLANSTENGSQTLPEGQNTLPEGQNTPENTSQNTFGDVPAPTNVPANDQWEQRYKTLQGMFAKINDQNAELRGQNAEFRGRLDELSAQVNRSQAPQGQPTQQPAKSRLLSDDEVRDYGAEFIDVTKRAAREEFEERIAEMQKRIDALATSQQTVTQTVQQSAKVAAETLDERYYNALDAGEPDWEKINQSQNFLTWLDEVDTFTGARRQALLNQAFTAKDAGRTLAFFKAFKQTHNGSGATPNKPSVDTASLVAPETVAGASPTPNSKRGKIWSQADVEKVYDDRVRGKITPQRFSELEKEIMAAVSEGRIK